MGIFVLRRYNKMEEDVRLVRICQLRVPRLEHGGGDRTRDFNYERVAGNQRDSEAEENRLAGAGPRGAPEEGSTRLGIRCLMHPSFAQASCDAVSSTLESERHRFGLPWRGRGALYYDGAVSVLMSTTHWTLHRVEALKAVKQLDSRLCTSISLCLRTPSDTTRAGCVLGSDRIALPCDDSK